MEREKFLVAVKHWPIRWLYTIFLAVLIALFFGLGVSAFYEAPKSPEYPTKLEYSEPVETETAEMKEAREKYDEDQKKYEEDFKEYTRNVSILTLVLAVLSLVIALTAISRISLISDALLLGGIFTLFYSIIRGLMTEDAKFRFVVVSVGLLITVALGYIKFIKKENK